ncbi:MAG: hypothetical protein JWO32_2769 [Bacteroidetes bacterium]|nr:hypothetical protein [Bacteroidota bacterium]
MEQSTASILKFNKNLLPDMVKLKYKLMTNNLYNFYRGTCHLYYEDLSKHKALPFSPPVWICGDLHMENFGSFKGDNRLVYFDLNDFDEAILAPASWEITRFVASLFIAFETMGIEHAKAINMAKLFLKTYSRVLANGKPYYLEPKTAKGIVCAFLKQASARKKKKLLEKRTVKVKNQRLIRPTTKHLKIEKTLKKELCGHITDWVKNHSGSPYNYQVEDVVFRVAGLGSMGLKRYLFLLKSTNRKEKYLLVDMKQSKVSSLAEHINLYQPAWKTESERIIEIQKRMQNIPPALLSNISFKKDDFVIQEMQSVKDGIKLNLIKHRYRDIYQVIDDMALLTASSQLRSAGRQNAANVDELIYFGQDANWQENILHYALKYTGKVKKDYHAFCTAYKDLKLNKTVQQKQAN